MEKNEEVPLNTSINKLMRQLCNIEGRANSARQQINVYLLQEKYESAEVLAMSTWFLLKHNVTESVFVMF